MIPYGKHEVTETDIEAVVGVLRSDFLTQGPVVPHFEAAITSYTGAKNAIATSNATAALHLTCQALGLGSNGLLWTSPISFVASANCGRYCGADVDFIDIDPETMNLSVSALKKKLTEARRESRLPDIVVSVHFAGQPPDQEEIWKLGQEFGFRIVEDASHALGASRNGEPAGSCRWSDAVVFSFHPVKMIAAGEGGMVLTNDEELAWRIRLLRTHGITRERSRMTTYDSEFHDYQQLELGWNCRLSDIHAALGLSQMSRLDQNVEKRNALARRYHQLLSQLPLRLPVVREENRSTYHLYAVRLLQQDLSQRDTIDELRKQGIGATLHYSPIHLQPYYRRRGFRAGSLPEAELVGRTSVTLPLYTSLSEQEQDYVVTVLSQILSGRTRRVSVNGDHLRTN
jgi:UDP-4-amino-4,6-dideoxy-N-acetyl-beta-L-altrosamine transaminase